MSGVILALALAGCGAQAPPPKPKPKTPLEAMKAKPASGALDFCVEGGKDAERTAVDRFNATHAKVTARYVNLADLDPERALAQVGSGGCDLLEVPDWGVSAIAAEGLAEDLTPYLNARRRDFFPATLRAVRYSGKDWGVPRAVDVRLLYYRKREVDTAPQTWQDVYTGSGEFDVLYAGGDGGLADAFLEVAYAAGGRVLTKDGLRSSALDSRPNRQALELLAAGVSNRAAIPAAANAGTDEVRKAFGGGLPATATAHWSY